MTSFFICFHPCLSVRLFKSGFSLSASVNTRARKLITFFSRKLYSAFVDYCSAKIFEQSEMGKEHKYKKPAPVSSRII